MNRIREVQVNALPMGPDASPFIAHLLGVSRRDVTGDQVAEARIAALQIVVALVFRDIIRRARVISLLGHPYASVIAQRFRHQRQLRLMLATERDTCRVNLREAWVGEQRAAAVCAPDGSAVARLRVRRQIEDVRIATRRQHNHVAGVAIDSARYQVPRYNATCSAIDDHDIEQLVTDVHRHGAGRHLLFQGLISAQQQLLSGLTASVESSLDLHSSERSSIEKATILARERHSLRHALVDYVETGLCEAVNVPLARAKIAALD